MRTALLLLAVPLVAQPPVAPTGSATESPDGQNVSGYNVLQSFEAGYRWRTVGGDLDMYRSTVNYGNGLRLLSSSLLVQSKDGKGKWFDQIILNTLGLGNDPYQFASLRIEKNQIYRYDFTWRSNAYFNPGLTIANGEHFMDTVRHMQDQDLTLFPQGRYKLFLGYSRNTQSGPALTTIQLFDSRGDEYPLFSNVKREQNEYRLGGEVNFWGFRLNALHGWEDFKDDTPVSITTVSQGNNPDDLNQLNSFTRSEPYHGTSPYWRVALFREGARYWAVNGRFTYVAGRRAFVLDELAAGTNRLGVAAQRQVVSFGDAQRPAATGNLTFSLFPVEWLTLTNQTSLYNIRMVGDSYFIQFDNGVPSTPVLPYQFLGIQTVANTTEGVARVNTWLTVRAGYGYSSRRIRSVEGTASGGPLYEQFNNTNDGTIGLTLRPLKPLSINLDAEIGRDDRPIYTISDKDYHALRARVDYKLRQVHLSAFARSDYNTNSNSITLYAEHTRHYGLDASWSPNAWFSIDTSYARLHVDSIGGLAYFAGTPSREVTTTSSFYESNIHSGTLAARFTVAKRADVSLGFSIVEDVGITSGKVVPAPPPFAAVQSFPLRYLSPQAKVSYKLQEKLRWNLGYQYYGYRDELVLIQDYRAHTGYTSLSWSF
jgi:hypothetical protein